MNGTAQDRAALSALNAKFIHNFVTCDVASHDAIIHPRFLCISSSGSVHGRVEYLHDWATDFDPEVILYWDMRDEHIEIFGDVALVRANTKWIRRIDDKEVTGMTMYTDTYLRENDKWLCIQAQLTPVSPQNMTADTAIVCRYNKGVLQS
ncbi:MAG: nuclear transport factor 2 family protein [Rhabdaerophilum sp.]